MNKILLIILIIAALLTSCGAPNDPILANLYTQNVYPGTTSTYTIGSSDLTYAEGHFDELNAETFTLTEYVWEDLRTPVSAIRVPGAKAPTWTAYQGSQVLAFADQAVEGNEEEVYFAMQLPHTYVVGTDIHPHVHMVFSADTVGDFARWGLETSGANINSEFPAATTIYVNAGPTNNNADIHLDIDFPDIDGSDMTFSRMFLCRLFRNSSHADDTYNDDIYLLEIDVHFLVDKLGSATEDP